MKPLCVRVTAGAHSHKPEQGVKQAHFCAVWDGSEQRGSGETIWGYVLLLQTWGGWGRSGKMQSEPNADQCTMFLIPDGVFIGE